MMSFGGNRSNNSNRKQRLAFYLQCAISLSSIHTNHAFAPTSAPHENKCDGQLCSQLIAISAVSQNSGRRGKFHPRKQKALDQFESNFELRMAMYENEDYFNHEPKKDQTFLDDDSSVKERREFLKAMFAASSLAAVSTTTSSAANAYEKAYPVTLDFEGNDTSRNLENMRTERISSQKAKAKQTKEDLLQNPLSFKDKKDVFGSIAWSGAIWLLSGSRSNPLVKPIANTLYDTSTKKGQWVKDRNEGMFSQVPLAFSILMGILFLVIGVMTDRVLLFSTEGDSNVVLQLAGVSLIGGASLELGRIASGEKMKTRENAERDETLANEFEEFASKKLIYGQGGSIHRSEVIKAFRRYFAKYRVENEEYPLGDLEIEQLLRGWNRRMGNLETMSSAGFIKNVKINAQAEIQM